MLKSEILGKPIFEHVPKESWKDMNDSLKTWFETGKVTDRKITFSRQDKTMRHFQDYYKPQAYLR